MPGNNAGIGKLHNGIELTLYSKKDYTGELGLWIAHCICNPSSKLPDAPEAFGVDKDRYSYKATLCMTLPDRSLTYTNLYPTTNGFYNADKGLYEYSFKYDLVELDRDEDGITDSDFVVIPDGFLSLNVEQETDIITAVCDLFYPSALFNKELATVDTQSPNLTEKEKKLVLEESIINPWYYFREVVQLPDNRVTINTPR